MAEDIFGPAFEIHGGGLDLVFPHHENEVAQSRALGHPFAQIWAHNGMLRFTGEKMSKSVGNVATIRETIDEWGREAVLVFFLTASWRKPIDFSPETMAQAAARRDTLRNAFTLAAADHDEAGWAPFAALLDDDFDTPAALAVLHEWASSGQLELLRRGLRIFGLETLAERDEAPAEVVDLAERRLAARAERDFETADRLRDELAALGWQMRDEPGGGYTLLRDA
jgi:cysteinyl-tRNA synthetase